MASGLMSADWGAAAALGTLLENNAPLATIAMPHSEIRRASTTIRLLGGRIFLLLRFVTLRLISGLCIGVDSFLLSGKRVTFYFPGGTSGRLKWRQRNKAGGATN